MRKAALTQVLMCLTGLTAARAADVENLLRAYPAQLLRIDGNDLVWSDQTRMQIDDGVADKTDQQLLDKPDLKDMFAAKYSAGIQAGSPSSDPGRFRNLNFFKKMYGDCRAGQVARNLVAVDWLPKHGGGKLHVTRVNDVHLKLRAVSDELDQLGDAFIKYLIPSAGTYNCRTIAKTQGMSAHSYGIAVDIGTKWSDYWQWSNGNYRSRIPFEIVDVFERHGFIWGGKWRHFDTMHFEYRPELLP